MTHWSRNNSQRDQWALILHKIVLLKRCFLWSFYPQGVIKLHLNYNFCHGLLWENHESVNRRTMNHNVKHLHFSKIVMYLVVYTKSEVCLILSLCFLFLVRLISVDAMCHQQIASNSGPWSFTPSMVSVCQRIPSGEPFTKSTKFI